jgi:hypothetical protein
MARARGGAWHQVAQAIGGSLGALGMDGVPSDESRSTASVGQDPLAEQAHGLLDEREVGIAKIHQTGDVVDAQKERKEDTHSFPRAALASLPSHDSVAGFAAARESREVRRRRVDASNLGRPRASGR